MENMEVIRFALRISLFQGHEYTIDLTRGVTGRELVNPAGLVLMANTVFNRHLA